MKYVSVIILLVLMSWSWSLATSESSFTLEQHKQVEAIVENDIKAFIVRRYPQTSDIYCQQFYTEVVKANFELIVHFRCGTQGDAQGGERVQQTFEGNIRLASSDNFQSWNEVGGEIRSPEIFFENGTQISAKDSAKDAKSDEPAAPATHEGEKQGH